MKISAKNWTARVVVCGALFFCTIAFAPAQDEDFLLKLTDTDLRSLINLVSLQTGTTFVVDPRVQGRVNVVSHTAVTEGTLYEIFLSVLQIHGYAAIPSGPVTKIVPDIAAKAGAIPLGTEGASDERDQLVSEVIRLKHISAMNLAPTLRPMVPQEGQLTAVPESNSLVITDRRSNIQRLKEIIAALDQFQQEAAEIFALRYASASQMTGLLSGLQSGVAGVSTTKVVADDRSNSVIVIGTTSARNRARDLIAQLDTPLMSNRNTRVIPLKFADADKIAKILRANAQGNSAELQSTNVTAEPVQNRGIMPRATISDQQGTGALPPADTFIQGPPDPVQSVIADERSRIQINADPDTNTIIITGSADQIANNVEIIKLLDVRRAQVQVEAVIAEITEDSISELGVNFLAGNRELAGFTNLGDGTENALGLAGAVQREQLPQSLDTGLSFAVGRVVDGGLNFGLLLRALKSDSDNNILSTPTIVTLDNEEAEIVVGSNVPFVTGQQLSANNDNPFQTIERQDVGLRLKVKPQINDDNTIKLTLEQEVSSVNPTALTGAVDITTSQRSLKTTVLVDDGQSLVLGGLIDEVLSDSEEKVPLLGDIPIVGNLFRHKVKTKSKTNLVVFLRPIIMRDEETASRVSLQQINTRKLDSGRFNLQRFNSNNFGGNVNKTLSEKYQPTGELIQKQPHSRNKQNRQQAIRLIDEATWQAMPDGSMKLIKQQ